MEGIKEAFIRVKEDISRIENEVQTNNFEIKELKKNLVNFCQILEEINKEVSNIESKIGNKKEELSSNVDQNINNFNNSDINLDKQTHFPTENKAFNTNNQNNQTDHNYFKPLNDQFFSISIGNIGVQTDKQTNRQTDKNLNFSSYNQDKRIENKENNSHKKEMDNSFEMANNLIDSLDNLKKEIRLKFKRLTSQELLIFSTIYQLEEEFGYSDYKSIASKLNLSESSIRDYVRRLTSKDIPIDKIKINNKEIHLSISNNLKKVASLNTIIQLLDI